MKEESENLLFKIDDRISKSGAGLCCDWVQWLIKEKRSSENTVSSYVSDVEDFLIFFRDRDTFDLVKNINFEELRLWLAYRIHKKSIGYRSNSRAISGVRSFFSYLKLRNITSNSKVFFLYRSGKENKKLPKILSEEQISSIVSSSLYSGEQRWILLRDKAILGLLYGSGLRISEALSLTFSSVQSEKIRITGKGGKERFVLVLPLVMEFLEQYIKECPYIKTNNNVDIYPLFFSKTGKILTRNLFAMHIRDIRNEVGLPEHMTPHAFRHSFATHLFWNNVDIRCIQEAMGHSSISSTQIYTHLDKRNTIEMYKKFHPDANINDDKQEE